MALFIANLAFDQELLDSAKLGIFLASVTSAALGIALLSRISVYGEKTRPGR
jgi:NhaA family Na+:H+ antiporter